MYLTLSSALIILSQLLVPLTLSSYAIEFVGKTGNNIMYINIASSVLRLLSVYYLIETNGQYDIIQKEINNGEETEWKRPKFTRNI